MLHLPLAMLGKKGESMPVEGPAQIPVPESIEPSMEFPAAVEMKPLEKKVEEVAEKPLGVLPEAAPSIISQREVTLISPPFEHKSSPEAVSSTLSAIMEEKGISANGSIGIEAVASRRFIEGINDLLAVGGYEASFSEMSVQTFSHDRFPKVDILFTDEGVTIAGIEEKDLSVFLQVVGEVDSALQSELSECKEKGELAVVPHEMVEKTEHVADNLFSEIATELKDRLDETGPSTKEAGEAREESEPEKAEEDSEEGGETVEREEENSPESSQQEIADVEETEAGTAANEETEEHHPAVRITRNSVRASSVDSLAKQWFHFLVLESKILSDQRKKQHRIQEERQQQQIEKEEIQKAELKKEQLKKEEKQKQIREDEESEYEEMQEIETDEVRESALTEKGISRDTGRQEERHDIGEYQEKKKAGEPAPPPSMPRS
jgi:hypothetical protein